MDYPTRAEAQGMADHQIAYGFMLLAMHKAIDAKQAQADEQIDGLQTELDKTHDLIRRMAKWYMSTEDTSDGIEYSDYTGLLDEANAMLSEKQAQT